MNRIRASDDVSRSPYARLIVLLFLVNVVNYVDRQLPFILIEEIKADLALSDAQMGLVSGMAFTLVYSLTTIPLAMLADRWSAKWVLTGAVTLWCTLTILSGQARTMLALAAARTGVAAGEAGCIPASHALISGLVPERRRAFAIAVFSLGIPIGGMLGLSLGGLLGDHFGWRTVMLLVGAPGLVLAVAIAVLVPDWRHTMAAHGASLTTAAGFRLLLAHPAMRRIVFSVSVQGIAQTAIYAFSAAFLIRSHGLSLAQAGLGLGLANGVSGVLALVAGGWLGTLDNRRALRLAGLAFIASAPLIVVAFLVNSAAIALALLAVFNFCALFYMPATFAAVQSLAPPSHRAIASSLVVLGVGLVGGTLGPTLAGVTSDGLTPTFGADALRYTLALAAIPCLIAGWQLRAAACRLPS